MTTTYTTRTSPNTTYTQNRYENYQQLQDVNLEFLFDVNGDPIYTTGFGANMNILRTQYSTRITP